MALPSGDGGTSLHPQHSVPCTEVASLGLLLLDHPEPMGVGGANGAEGVRSPRVIANSKEGGGEELVAEAGKVATLLGCWAIKTPQSEKNRFVENSCLSPVACPSGLTILCFWQEKAEDPAGHSVPHWGPGP